MVKWNLTSECEPIEGNELYLITGHKSANRCFVAWFFKSRQDFDGGEGNTITDYQGNVTVRFPVWCDAELHDDVGEDSLEYYVLDPPPYAWAELPPPSGDIDPCEEEFNTEIANIESLF